MYNHSEVHRKPLSWVTPFEYWLMQAEEEMQRLRERALYLEMHYGKPGSVYLDYSVGRLHGVLYSTQHFIWDISYEDALHLDFVRTAFINEANFLSRRLTSG